MPLLQPPRPLLRPLAALVTLVALGGACSDSASGPVATVPTPDFNTNGTPSGSSYPSVGALVLDWWEPIGTIDGNDQWCTGSLVSATVFVTAAHCVVGPDTPPGTQFYVSFAPDLLSRQAKFIKATGYASDPAYNHDMAHLHDLAVVVLPAAATRGMTPLALPPAGYLDGLAAQGGLTDQLFVNVGYGSSSSRTGNPNVGFGWDGKRNVSRSEFMGLQPTWLGLLMNANATGEGGDCYGDSGGPKFLDGQPNMVVATVVTGDYPCRATSWNWRLDTPEARGFLGQFVALP